MTRPAESSQLDGADGVTLGDMRQWTRARQILVHAVSQQA